MKPSPASCCKRRARSKSIPILSTSTAARSRSAIRWARPAQCCSARPWTNLSEAANRRRSSPCALAAGRASPRSSKGCEPMTSRKAKQKQESREAIQVSAAALLSERGIKASSVMDVMKGAGLTVGGFYNHFDSKEDLFVQVLQNASRANWNNLLKAARGASPRARALNVTRQYLSRQHRDCKD